MGNKFGNYASKELAAKALKAKGFVQIDNRFKIKEITSGSLTEPPRAVVSIVEITSYKVDAKFSSNGQDYFVFQHHFIA